MRSMRSRNALVIVLTLSATLAGCVPPVVTPPAGVTVWMDPTYGSGFFSMPWPNDLRRQSDGTLDLLGFPGTDRRPELFAITALASRELTGFGTQTAVYVRMTGTVDPATLPSPIESTHPDSSVQLIDLDHPGERIPVIVRVEPSDPYRPPNLVSLLPYPGHTMRPDTRYAAVVTTGVRDASGAPLAAAPLLHALDEDWWLGRARSERDWATLRAQRDAVRRALAAGAGVHDLVGFSVFRTADSTREMRAIISTLDGLEIPAPQLDPGSCGSSESGLLARHGMIELPNFQFGDYPFTTSGGGLSIDRDGRARLAGWRSYPIVLRVPCGEPPAAGWPIETFIDGTGGSANLGGVGLVDQAMAASIPPLFGMGTGVANPFTEANFYNTLNPEAVRINPLQQAANHIALLKSLEVLVLDGATYASPTPVRADPGREMISGHSQGAQTLPLVASMHPQVTTVVSSSGVAGFYNQVAYRTSGRQQLGAYTGIDPLDIRNPWDQLVDMVEDLAEPANYPNSADYLNFAGKLDGCVPLEAARHLAASQGLTIVNPQWPSIFGAPSLDPPTGEAPVSNTSGGRTRVSLENPGGHFTGYANQELARSFVEQSLLAGVSPTVGPGPYGSDDGNCEPRFGAIGSGT